MEVYDLNAQEQDSRPGLISIAMPTAMKKKPHTKTQKILIALGCVAGLVWGVGAGIRADEEKAKGPECGAPDGAWCAIESVRESPHGACATAVEKSSRYGMRWVSDAIFSRKFTSAGWVDKQARIVVLQGDQAEFKNEFGGYVRSTYSCTYDLRKQAVVESNAEPGRLAP